MSAVVSASTPGPLVWQFLVRPDRLGQPATRAVAAAGVRILFSNGASALCGTSGLWNVNLGYGNTAIAAAIHEALRDSSYLTLFRYGHEAADRAAQALIDAVGPQQFGRVVYSTSGSAANDLAIKIARLYALLGGEPQRRLIVGLWPSYHGMTYGAFALTGEALGQRLYGADRSLVRHLPHNDIDTLDRFMARHGDQVAAVVVEPVAGTGALPLSTEYLDRLLAARTAHGFLVVADEVATGFYRCGPPFAHQRWSGVPDIVIVSKGLSNGTCATAAILTAHHVHARFDEQDAVLAHGETQAGTPPTCAAIVATIEEMARLDVATRAARLGSMLDERLADPPTIHRLIRSASGVGCFRALRLAGPDGHPFTPAQVEDAVDAIRVSGAIVHPGPGAIQLIPPLVYTEDDLEELFECVVRGLDRLG